MEEKANMSRSDFISFIIKNGYAYAEDVNEIQISRISENRSTNIIFSYDKINKKLEIWISEESGSGYQLTLTQFEMLLIKTLGEAEWVK